MGNSMLWPCDSLVLMYYTFTDMIAFIHDIVLTINTCTDMHELLIESISDLFWLFCQISCALPAMSRLTFRHNYLQ